MDLDQGGNLGVDVGMDRGVSSPHYWSHSPRKFCNLVWK